MTHLHQLRNQYASQKSLASPEANDEVIQAASDQKKWASRNARRRSVGSFVVESNSCCSSDPNPSYRSAGLEHAISTKIFKSLSLCFIP